VRCLFGVPQVDVLFGPRKIDVVTSAGVITRIPTYEKRHVARRFEELPMKSPAVSSKSKRSRVKRFSIAALLASGFVAVTLQQPGHADPGDAFPYSKGFLITGDYVASGVDLTPQANPADASGFATGTISFPTTNAVPAESDGSPADIVGAFLYWESIYKPGTAPTLGVKFRGTPIDPATNIADPATAAANAWPNEDVPGLKATSASLLGKTASCWGSANQANNATLTMFRYDVLHLLPKLYDTDNRWTGKRLVNSLDLTNNKDLDGTAFAQHTVTLPEKTGDQAVQSAGATLVVIYRRVNDPLTKVVFYDGLFAPGIAIPGVAGSMSQTLRGFYQRASGATGKLTQMAGNGGNNQTDTLSFNNQALAVNPFPQTSPSSDRSWANPTFSALSMSGTTFADFFGETATTSVTHTNTNQDDCLAWGGVVFSTQVLDADNDGLPDALEYSTNAALVPPAIGTGGNPWTNPDGQRVPDLHGMGATPDHKDIFIEIGAMTTGTATMTYGTAGSTNPPVPAAPFDSSASPIVYAQPVAAHSHLPNLEMLALLGDAYKNAPVTNIDTVSGIRAHFDVGDPTASPYLCNSSNSAPAGCEYLVPRLSLSGETLPRGGELITERACAATDPKCQFPSFPGTVGWRFGYQANRDAAVDDAGNELTTQAQIDAWKAAFVTPVAPYATHRMRFDPVRRSLFHYVLYAHARGKPRSLPCLVHGLPADYDTTTGQPATPACTTANPYFNAIDYHVPSSGSGVADLPGGGALITLGLWDTVLGTGTPFVQASTTFHELGHNGNLWHGGAAAKLGSKAAATSTTFEANCKPDYLSTMSYLFQVHGLIDVFNAPQLDYSRTAYKDTDGTAINENALPSTDSLTAPVKYRPTWYAPLNSPLALSEGATAATRFCNGVKFDQIVPPFNPTAAQKMGRVWTPTPLNNDWSVNIQWLGGLTGSVSNVNLDAVFRGTQTFSTALKGFDDWSSLKLNQIGAGHNKVSFAAGADSAADGADSAADGADSAAEGADSAADGADSAADGADSAADGADSAADGADSAADGADSAADAQELDFHTARVSGRSTAAKFTACVLGGTGTTACTGSWIDNAGVTHTTQPTSRDKEYLQVYTTWKPPTFGRVLKYLLYRSTGTAAATQVGSTSNATTFTLVDMTKLTKGAQYTYSVRVQYNDGVAPEEPANPIGPSSNFVPVTIR
jgi:hypothetical protein